MIKFFRHLRQRMIKDVPESRHSWEAGLSESRGEAENRLPKYLLYAFGEIVLVVIGILIALQINTWNNNRVDKHRAQDFAGKLKIQLNSNIQTVERKIKRIESWYSTTLKLLPIIGIEERVNIDDKIDSLILANSHDYHLNLDMNTITEGRENGNMTLISSDSTRKCIYLVTTLNERIKERERITNEDLNTLFTPYLNRHYNYRNLVNKNYVNQNIGASTTYAGDNYKMLSEQQFENYIASRMEYNIGMIKEYRKMRTLLKKTVQML